MTFAPTLEGEIPFVIASVDKPCFTYYKVFGDISCGVSPLVCLHGGPGAGHEYLLSFAELWPLYGIPVIFYDQIGCAASTHLQEKNGDRSFWQEELFVKELDNLLDFLQLRGGFHLLGHSWGGMLGPAYASRQPEGLKRMVLASGLASKALSMESARITRDQLPSEHQEAILEAERTRNLQNPAYKAAMGFYQRTYLCRTDAPVLEIGFKHMQDDNTVFGTMNGSSHMFQDGSMLYWTSIPRLHRITAPTLIYNGEYDSSLDIAQVPFFELIPQVRWITYADAGHMCHLEDRGIKEKVLRDVGEFLSQKPRDTKLN